MKITNNVSKILDLYKDNSTINRAVKNKDSVKKDEVQISQAVKDMPRYIEAASKSNTTSEKVDIIRQKIINKEYKVDTKELAKAILNEISESGDK